jgi:ABC-type uncharacterized transport system involved in gliding motility auxiliary subunit
MVVGILANLPEIREALVRRSARMGPQVFIQAALIVLVFSLINTIAMRNDRIKDMTRRSLFTLSPVTEEVVSNLPGEVEVMAFFPGGGPGEAVQRLQLYDSAFPLVNLRFIDPDRHENVARAEAVPPQVGVLFKYGDNRVWITKFEENDITNAFIKVTRTTTPKVLFTTGHGEPDLESQGPNGLLYLKRMLEQQGYEPEAADLQTMERIPEEVSMVALVGPSLFVSDHERDMLDYYLGQGGNAIVFLDPVLEAATFTGLERFIELYGVRPEFNVIFDPKHHLVRDRFGLSIVLTKLSNHTITQGLTEPRVVFSWARSLKARDAVPQNLFVERLVESSGESYERILDPEVLFQLTVREDHQRYIRNIVEGQPGPGESKGPFVLAYAIRKTHRVERWKQQVGADRPRELRLIVMGTSSVCRNQSIAIPYNYELVMNAFNWLAGEKDLRFIRSLRRGGSRLYLDERQKDGILYVSIMIIPEVFMIIGLAVWWRRR